MHKLTLQLIRNSKGVKHICIILSMTLILQIALPVASYGLTSGSAQPEFTSFEPVVTTDLVNDFTGDFTYNLPVLNIPGPDGAGYAMSLSYHSGASSEEESSWVGFGWTLNPGAINRQKRGYPDDFKKIPVTKYNKIKPNWTQSSTTSFNMELNTEDKEKKDTGEGADKSKGLFSIKFGSIPKTPAAPPSNENDSDEEAKQYKDFMSFSLTKAVRYNNYSGFSIANSFGAGYKGKANLSMTRSGGENTLGVSINPIAIFSNYYNSKTKTLSESKSKLYGKNKDKTITSNLIKKRSAIGKTMGFASSLYSSWSYNAPAIPYSISYNTGRSYNFSGSVQLNPYGPVGFQVGLAGNLNTQINIPITTIQANGYMYQPNYVDDFSAMVKKDYYDLKDSSIPIVEGDFQIEKATTFNKHDKRLGIPYNNADILMATGNNVMGGFRFHHKNIGTNYPSLVTNKQQIRQLGVEFAIGGTIQIGLDIGNGWQKTITDKWKKKSRDIEYNTDLPFLQFSNDMGGSLRYSDNDALQFATISKLKELELETFDNQTEIKDDIIGQSSVINYALFNNSRELDNVLDNNHKTIKGVDGQVGQIAITNKDGSKSYYGLPVKVK